MSSETTSTEDACDVREWSDIYFSMTSCLNTTLSLPIRSSHANLLYHDLQNNHIPLSLQNTDFIHSCSSCLVNTHFFSLQSALLSILGTIIESQKSLASGLNWKVKRVWKAASSSPLVRDPNLNVI